MRIWKPVPLLLIVCAPSDMLAFLFHWLIVPYVLVRFFVKSTHRRCESKACLVGKTAIVTGGSRGIGLQTVLGLAARGCKVIIACRSKGEDVKNEIVRKTNNHDIHVKYLDLASFASIRQFAKEMKNEEERIDILINNAGLGTAIGMKPTEDGFNQIMQINLIGAFLLTHLLLDLLKKSDNARIIFVSSILSFTNNLTLENLKGMRARAFMEHWHQYGNSKLGQIIVSHELARKLKKFGITSNAIHPGIVMTDIFADLRNRSWWITANVWFGSLFSVTVEEGAQRTLTFATSNKYRNITGSFTGTFGYQPKAAKDATFRKKVWEALEGYAQLRTEEKITDI